MIKIHIRKIFNFDIVFYITKTYKKMQSFDLAAIVKKHGVVGVLCAWLFYTNIRLNDVEDKLYSCYDQSRFAAMSNRSLHSSIEQSEKIYAVLPERKRRSNEEVLV